MDYNLLFRGTRQARLSSLGLPPLPQVTPHSASSFRMGSRPKPRGSPWPEPPQPASCPVRLAHPAFGASRSSPSGRRWVATRGAGGSARSGAAPATSPPARPRA